MILINYFGQKTNFQLKWMTSNIWVFLRLLNVKLNDLDFGIVVDDGFGVKNDEFPIFSSSFVWRLFHKREKIDLQ